MQEHDNNITENKSKSFSNDNVVKSTSSSASNGDSKPNSNNQSAIHQLANSGPHALQLKANQELANNSQQNEEAIQFHSIANGDGGGEDLPKKNNTGLPAQLKAGIEGLSGMSLDDVKVHRNSDKPAQLQAHAYAQGSDIHLGAGQEEHLAHEAWHVVQQKQGRVKPTMQMKGKVSVNDDAGLEKEADIMGAKAMKGSMKSLNVLSSNNHKKPLKNNNSTAQLASTGIGNEEVTVDDNAQGDAMAFLTPNTPADPAVAGDLGNQSAPVHLTKNVASANALNKINAAAPLTHASLNAENSANMNEHFTLTSGFMTAALVDSPIKNYIVKQNKAAQIWMHEAVNTQVLSQNKLNANQIVSAFNTDLELAEGANFDNLMFIYSPEGHGPTFDQVLSFHNAVYAKLNSTPAIDADGDLPFTNVSYVTMRDQIVAGADALADQWSNWTGGDEATRNDFKIAPDKWTDLSKAANILNRIRIKALQLHYTKGHKIETNLFDTIAMDADFFQTNLFGDEDHHAEMDTMGNHLAAHNEHHSAEFETQTLLEFLHSNISNLVTLDMNNAEVKKKLYRYILEGVTKKLSNAVFTDNSYMVKNDAGADHPFRIEIRE